MTDTIDSGSTGNGAAPQTAGDVLKGVTYTGDSKGLRDAAIDHAWANADSPRTEETDEQVRNPHKPFTAEMFEDLDGYDPEKGISARHAAQALKVYHDTLDEHAASIDKALGFGEEGAEEAAEEVPPESPRQSRLEQENEQFRKEIETVKQQTTAELNHTHQLRQQHIQGLQFATAVLEQQFISDFPEIRSANDFHNLADTNPERYVKAYSALTRAQTIMAQHAQAAQQANEEVQRHVSAWTAEQDRIFTAKHPDLADPKVGYEVGQRAMKMLESVGVTKAEVQALWSGHQDISFRDARTQEILLDALKYRELQDRIKGNRPPKPLPPVQRPGVAKQRVSTETAELRAAQRDFDQNNNVRTAARLHGAKRRAGMVRA